MIDKQIFHVYKKNSEKTEVIAHSLTVDEVEQGLVDKTIDLALHEIHPCYNEFTSEEPSF